MSMSRRTSNVAKAILDNIGKSAKAEAKSAYAEKMEVRELVAVFD
jgi:hypothetical protein